MGSLVEIKDRGTRLSLPGFAARRMKWLGIVTVGGKTRRYLTSGIPPLTAEEVSHAALQINELEATLAPADRDDEMKLALLAEMFLTFPTQGQSQTELVVKTKSRIYGEVLADVPAWALRAALRKWYAGKVPGIPEATFTWSPSPAQLLRAS